MTVRDLTLDTAGWVRAMCQAPSAEPDEIASALGIDLADARRVGSQLVCRPPTGTDRFELVLDLTTGVVSYAVAVLAPPLPLERLTERFGAARTTPPGPHDTAPTMMFDQVRPDGAARSCVVLAQLADAPPDAAEDLVASVILYLHPAPSDPV